MITLINIRDMTLLPTIPSTIDKAEYLPYDFDFDELVERCINCINHESLESNQLIAPDMQLNARDNIFLFFKNLSMLDFNNFKMCNSDNLVIVNGVVRSLYIYVFNSFNDALLALEDLTTQNNMVIVKNIRISFYIDITLNVTIVRIAIFMFYEI
jgi:hypothetical protein